MKARESAFFALLFAEKGGKIEEFFLEKEKILSAKDLRLAKEIAFGTQRRLLSLEYLAEKIAKRKLLLSKKEKLLLYSALYQHFFLQKIPLYAIVNETVRLVKLHCRSSIGSLFNALLRKLSKEEFSLPKENLSLFYSYPPFFIERILTSYGKEKAEEIFKVQNTFFPPQVRLREERKKVSSDWEKIYQGKFSLFCPSSEFALSEIGKDSSFYFQNVTFVHLMEEATKEISPPEKILDLCAAPGGKLLLAHDLFPKASLYANDLSEKRMELLKQNFQKYGLSASFTIGGAEEFSSNELFDLILLDVPCSNSGTLHKRAEARWRLSFAKIQELTKLQLAMIERTFPLLSKKGQIWYFTCSILPEENEGVIREALLRFPLKQRGRNHLILPDVQGSDGGFLAVLESR